MKVYGEGDVAVRALDHVTVDIPRGAFTAVMGPSGCGKSTLVHCLAGLDTLTSGEIEVGGQRLAAMSEKAADDPAPRPRSASSSSRSTSSRR